MKRITIVDFAGGNLNALKKKLNDFGFDAHFTSSTSEISNAKFLLIPGVGHFNSAMNNLRESNLIDILNEKVLVQKTPVIGICLGMQLFTNYSEEGNCDGLGWINAETKLFKPSDRSIKVPNIGWNPLIQNPENNFYSEEDLLQKYYFIHSYYVNCESTDDVLSYTDFSGELFCSSLRKNNIMGFQFHPEKSHKGGLMLLIKAINQQIEKYGI